MTFTLPGLLVALAVLAPNALLLVFRPTTGIPRTTDAGLLFTILERAGQVGCLVVLTMSGARGLDGWLVGTLIVVAGYWALWARYLARRRFADLYAPLGPLPIPMAVLPVLAFGLAAAWAASWWLGIAVVLLAVGHLANSWTVYRQLSTPTATHPGR